LEGLNQELFMNTRTKSVALFMLLTVLANGSGAAQAYGSAAGSVPLGGNAALTEIEQDVHAVEVLHDNDQGITLSVQVPWTEISLKEVEVEGVIYIDLELPDWAETSIAGFPQLPFLTEQFGVPAGSQITLAVKTGKSHEYQLSHPLLPAATKVAVLPFLESEFESLTITDTESHFEIDPMIYSQEDSYPVQLASVSSDGFLRQQRVAGVNIFPIQYLPTKNTLVVYESLEVQISFERNATASTEIGKPEFDAYEQLFKSTLLNYETAKQWRTFQTEQVELSGASSAVTSTAPWSPPSPGWRIKTTTEGMHKLTYAELQDAGVPVGSLDPRTLQLFNSGEEVAIRVIGEDDGVFDTSDYILFFAELVNTKYTAENVFWLTHSAVDQGLRMQVVDGTPVVPDIATSFLRTRHFENNLYYVSQIPGGDQFDRWMGDYLPASNQQPVTYSFNLSSPAATTATLKLAVMGYTTLSHQLIVKLNNVILGSFQFTGKTYHLFDTTVAEGLLVAGQNTLQFSTPDTGLSLFLDWVDLTYESGFNAEQGKIIFETSASNINQYQVGGFSSAAIFVFDVTDPALTKLVTGGQVSETGGLFTINFQGSALIDEKYSLVESSAFMSVKTIELDVSSNLSSTMNAADYIVITPEIFLSQAETLSAYRSSKGLRTVVVKLQDIYDEFGYGLQDVTYIRDFLSYTYLNWESPAPAYVVLFGDGNQDPKMYINTSSPNYMPAYLAAADPWMIETAADNRYVTFIGDDTLPDMMLGRLAASNVTEATILVSKIISYGESTSSDAWKRKVLFVADDADVAGNFSQISESLIDCCLNDLYQPQRVFFKVTHPDVSSTRAAIISAINQGALIVNYVGHASRVQWADEGIFRLADVNSLNNADKLAVVLSMTCLDGQYQQNQPGASNRSMAETLTVASGKGAVASWSPTGLGVSSGHDYLNRGFYETVFGYGTTTIGEGTAAGKLRLWSTGGNLDLLDTYLLFGDPAMVLTHTPVAFDQNDSTPEDTSKAITLVATDAYEHPLTYEIVAAPSHGDVVIAENTATYTPTADYNGPDSFTFKANDGAVDSNVATVSVTVIPVNDPPVLDPIGAHIVDEMAELTFTATASDPDLNVLTFSLIGEPDGAAIDPISGVFTWTPTVAQGPGEYNLIVKVCDDATPALCDEEEIAITVLSVNETPVAVADSYTTAQDTQLVVAVPGVLENDTDVDLDDLTAELVANVSDGMLILVADGSFTYTPTAGFIGEVSFTYKAFDGELYSEEVTVTITVTEMDPEPVNFSIYLPLILR